MNEQPQLSLSLRALIPKLCEMCTKLNSCLPQSEQIEITVSLESIMKGMHELVQKIVNEINSFEKILQMQEQNLRKHIKNQIELKLYYEHLEDIIVGLRREKQQNHEAIHNLKTQLTVLKQKQKHYMTISNANTRNDDGLESKLDTIAKIKNRLSLNGTEQFYSNYFAKKFQKDSDTKQLRDKRQSLANALKQLYESPVQHREDILRPKKKTKSKSRQKKQSKDRSHNNSTKNIHSLNKNRSTKSVLNNTETLPRKSFKEIDRSQRGSLAKQKSGDKSKQMKQRKIQRGERVEKMEKHNEKSTINNYPSRRNSKA